MHRWTFITNLGHAALPRFYARVDVCTRAKLSDTDLDGGTVVKSREGQFVSSSLSRRNEKVTRFRDNVRVPCMYRVCTVEHVPMRCARQLFPQAIFSIFDARLKTRDNGILTGIDSDDVKSNDVNVLLGYPRVQIDDISTYATTGAFSRAHARSMSTYNDARP